MLTYELKKYLILIAHVLLDFFGIHITMITRVLFSTIPVVYTDITHKVANLMWWSCNCTVCRECEAGRALARVCVRR